MKLNAFLNFGGNCEAALRLYKQHLGGKIFMPIEETFFATRFGQLRDGVLPRGRQGL